MAHCSCFSSISCVEVLKVRTHCQWVTWWICLETLFQSLRPLVKRVFLRGMMESNYHGRYADTKRSIIADHVCMLMYYSGSLDGMNVWTDWPELIGLD